MAQPAAPSNDAAREIKSLPSGWTSCVERYGGRVVFYRKSMKLKDGNPPLVGQQSEHPIQGALREPWELRGTVGLDSRIKDYFYFNPSTKETMRGPRPSLEEASSRNTPLPGTPVPLRNSATASSVAAGKSILRRHAIGSNVQDLCAQYQVVKIIDAGVQAADNLNGRGKGKALPRIGGMNGGVYVVKSFKTSRLFVRKDLFATDEGAARRLRRELRLMRDLMHCGLVSYVEAAVQGGDRRDEQDPWLLRSSGGVGVGAGAGAGAGQVWKEGKMQNHICYLNGHNPLRATVLMEYCDLGSLDDLLERLQTVKQKGRNCRVPEGFLWHAFMAVTDALAFLQTGTSYKAQSLHKDMNKYGWKKLVHGDIKPDNIFLRSRSKSSTGRGDEGGARYPYVILADWGMARSEEGAREDDMATIGDQGNIVWWLSGSLAFHAPELTFYPHPPPVLSRCQAAPHTCESDVWALACCIYCVAERDTFAHLDRRYRDRPEGFQGRKARRECLKLDDGRGFYSQVLGQCLEFAGHSDPNERPDAVTLLEELKTASLVWRKLMKEKGCGGDEEVDAMLLQVKLLEP